MFPHRLISILSSTKQVVSGYKFVIRAKYSTTKSGDQECTTEIWSQPWLGKKEVTFNCDNHKDYTFTINKPTSKINKRSLFYERDEGIEPSSEQLALEQKFSEFEIEFKRKYSNSHARAFRKRIFKSNLAKIDQLNQLEQGTASYGVTKFADMTEAEFNQYKGLNPRELDTNAIPNPMAEIPNKELPKSFDWRDQKVISKVIMDWSSGDYIFKMSVSCD